LIEPGVNKADEEAHRTWRLRSLALYFAFAYVFSLLIWLPALIRNNRSYLFLALGMFGPTIAAFVTQRIVAGNWKAVRLWSNLPRFLIGLFYGGLIILLAAFAAALLMTKSGFSRWQWSTLVQILILFAPNLLGGPLGEEAGWRSFALSRMQLRFNPVVSALIVGFFWANWHLPLILAYVYNVTWWQFVLLTIAASIFLSFGFNVAGNVLTGHPILISHHPIHRIRQRNYSQRKHRTDPVFHRRSHEKRNRT
jgi:uncharacterized protein